MNTHILSLSLSHTPTHTHTHLVRMEGQTFGGSYLLSHEAVMVANVVQELLLLQVVNPDGLLRRGADRKQRVN